MTDALLDRLRGALGAAARAGRGADDAVHGVAPRAVAEPASAEQVAALLELASAESWRVEPAGRATRLGWGRPPRRVDVLLSTRRLTATDEYEPADLTGTFGAGLTHAALEERVRPNGQWLPLDPPGAAQGSLGATFALAASGPLRAGFGAARGHVLGLDLVTGDGRLLRLGGRVVKNVAGYDLTRLVVGSRGTLGVVTRLSVRLRPLPAVDRTFGFCAPGPEPLLDGVAALRRARVDPAALELLSPGAAVACGLRGGGWGLLLRAVGLEVRARDLEERASAHVPADRWHPDAGAWRALAGAEATSPLLLRLAALPASLPRTLELARELAIRLGAEPGLAAHAGEGIVRLWLDRADAAPAAELGRAIEEARTEMESADGTLTVAVAPPALLAEVEPFGRLGGAALGVMRELKQRFDPAAVLAAGRYVV